MIIAVDFDGTLCTNTYPEIGGANYKLIWELKARQSMGDKLILWTCRAGELLQNAVDWCKSNGLVFDAVNDNVPEMIMKWGNNSRKITADIYVDDRSCSPFDTLFEMVV